MTHTAKDRRELYMKSQTMYLDRTNTLKTKAECGKRFKRAGKLVIHMKLHHDGTMKYVCEEEGCTKANGSVASLTLQYMSHTPSAQFKCEQCGRHFIDKLKLDRHSSVH